MTFLEGLSFFYIILSVAGFTVGYFALCGIRQYVADARTGATYRVEDEKFREATLGQRLPVIR